QLRAKPTTTIATPSRCGKFFRANSSLLGQTTQRCRFSPSIAPSGIAVALPQCVQAMLVVRSSSAARVVAWQCGQAYVTFMLASYRVKRLDGQELRAKFAEERAN